MPGQVLQYFLISGCPGIHIPGAACFSPGHRPTLKYRYRRLWPGLPVWLQYSARPRISGGRRPLWYPRGWYRSGTPFFYPGEGLCCVLSVCFEFQPHIPPHRWRLKIRRGYYLPGYPQPGPGVQRPFLKSVSGRPWWIQRFQPHCRP